MLAKIIFCCAVSLATLAVVLLALLPYKVDHVDETNSENSPSVALSLYIQQPTTTVKRSNSIHRTDTGAAFIFRRMLTEGPETTSTIVGKAQGFIIPVERFAHSAFNVVYVTFTTPQYSGSLSIQAEQLELIHNKRQELKVVGGTGSFAFARGIAVFEQADNKDTSDVDSPIYQLDLQLTFPSQLQSIH